MLMPTQQQMMLPGATSRAIPAAVRGWNARDTVDAMDPADAETMVNLWPGLGKVSLRSGFREWADGMGAGSIESIFEHVAVDGSKTLIACANNNIYDASNQGSSASSLNSGYTNNRWQGIVMNSTLVMVNGDDTPQKFDGTLAANTFTGIGTPANLIHLNEYRSRLYAIEKNSTSFWVGGVEAIAGALTEWDVGFQLTRGGYLLASATWSVNSGNGLNDYFVAISSEGEVLVYAGTHPLTGGTFVLVHRSIYPRPIGRRCFVQFGTQLAVITVQGVIPLTDSIFQQGMTGNYETLSNRIELAFNERAILHSSNFGWQGVAFPFGQKLLFNVPLAENGQSYQFVMNTVSKAWTLFKDMNASCWCVFNDQLLFGGNDGSIYQADYGETDNSEPINWEIRQAYNYFGDRGSEKHFKAIKPVFDATGSITFLIGVDVDGNNTNLGSPSTFSDNGATAWGSDWGAPWGAEKEHFEKWIMVSQMGRAGAIHLSGSYTGVQMDMIAFHVAFEPLMQLLA